MLGLLIIVCLFAQHSGSPDCVFGDSVCWTKYFSIISPKIANGIPELGTERLDPMHLDYIETKRSDLFLKMTNNTLSGLKESIIDNISNHKDLKVMVLVFRANLTMRGDYTINGSVFSIPMTGNGKITILKNNCRFEMIMPYEIIKNRINLKYFVLSSHAYGGSTYSLENLMDGQNGISDKIHALFNENWRVVESYMGGEFINQIMTKIFKSVRVVVASYEIKL